MALAKYDGKEDELRELVENQKLQLDLVAKQMGVHRATVTHWCKRFGIQTQRTGPRDGPGHKKWRGGRRMVGGYLYIYTPDHPHQTRGHYVAEHRLVMEKKLGRFLRPSEVVHHIDGNPLNNHPDNLVVFQTNAEHLRAELTGKCPKWTDDGKQRILDALHNQVISDATREKRRQVALSQKRNRDQLGRYACQQPQTTDHCPE
jgi:hypothetical protein